MSASDKLAEEFCQAITFIHANGWAPGTGGNFSCVLQKQPLKLLMAPSGVDKGAVSPDDLIVVNQQGDVLQGAGRASAETLVHTAIASALHDVGAVFHAHSVFNTLLSERYVSRGALCLSGYEMLKGLEGFSTHESTIDIPILPNTQDMLALSQKIPMILRSRVPIHGFLLAGHGLYTWGTSIFAAKRHLEILEFLLEVFYRKSLLNPSQ